MISKSSIHIDPGHTGHYSHNSRESFSHSQVFSDEKNEYYNDTEAAIEIYQRELHWRSETYTKRTNQKLQNKTVTHLSAIINLHDHHTLDDMEPVCDHLEKTLDTVITQRAIHRDEGKIIHKETGEILTSGIDFFMDPSSNKLYYDKEYTEELDASDWKVEKNIHAHVEMLGIDSNGNAIKRNRLNKYYLRELQSFVADTLNMERGQYTESYSREQIEHIKSHMKPRSDYKNKKDYGSSFNQIAKQLGYFIEKKKRLDTHDFKAKMKSQNEIDNEKRKARELLKKKDEELNNKQELLVEAINENEMLKLKILDYERASRTAEQKEISHALIVSRIKEDVEVLREHKKALEENNNMLIYAKGWKRKGEPVKKDELIKHLNEKSKKASSEKQDYIDKHDSLLENHKKTESDNTQLKIENKSFKEALKGRDDTIEALHSIMNELKDEIDVLTDRVQQTEKDKVVLQKKEPSKSQHITMPGMRF